MDSKYNIAELFFMRMTGMETEAERKRLDDFIGENPEYVKLSAELSDYANYMRRKQKIEALDLRKELRKFLAPMRRRRPLRRYAVRVAAVVIPLSMIGAGIFMMTHRNREPLPLTPPGWEATLRLSDGTDMELGAEGRTTINDNGIDISVKDRMLDYQNATMGEGAKISGNRLIVGRNNRYKLLLNDGTAVWLNSESELLYPAVFGGGERRVTLTGEACFEVAEDGERPFIVTFGDGCEIRVLGTKFNVRAYPGDPASETSLLRGSVAIRTASGRVVLEPAQQAVIRPDGGYDIREIDPSYPAAWIEGWFFFDDKPLYEVLTALGRWYDVEFSFAKRELKDITVSGKLRQLELDTILGLIGTTAGVEFGIDGRDVRVTAAATQ